MSTRLQKNLQVAKTDADKKPNLVETLRKRTSNLYSNSSKLLSIAYDWTIWTVYHYGLHLSILYGISTRPPYLMYAWYSLTGNKAAIERMMSGAPM